MELTLDTDRMRAHTEGAIGWMIFDHPERHNALSLDMWAAVPRILDDFEADPEVRVVVLAGAGERAFISGADISQFEEQRSSVETRKHYDLTAGEANRRLQETPLPTIAMIRGYCEAHGVEIDDETLRAEAIEWQATRGARSGRVAWQYIQDLAGRLGKPLAD